MEYQAEYEPNPSLEYEYVPNPLHSMAYIALLVTTRSQTSICWFTLTQVTFA
jgi:hypothetical protein